jgi:hypothetical protein
LRAAAAMFGTLHQAVPPYISDKSATQGSFRFFVFKLISQPTQQYAIRRGCVISSRRYVKNPNPWPQVGIP